MFLSPFRRFASKPIRRRRDRSLRQRGRSGLTGWETLGLGMGDALCATEALEARAMMAADLAVSISDGHVWYAPGTEVTYKVRVVNNGDATATDALVSTTLGSKLSAITWTAAYSSGASGPVSGSGNLANAKITLGVNKSVDFEIVGTVASDATGDLVSTATVSLDGESITTNNSAIDTNKLAPKSIVVTDDAGWTSTDLVRVITPGRTAGESDVVRKSFHAYGNVSLRGGMQAVVVDIDNDGRDEIVTAPGRGRIGEIRVFTSKNDAGTEYEEDKSYRTTPFGSGWTGGLTIAAGDFNGDGRVDLAAAKATGDGEIRIFNGQSKVNPGDDPIANSYRTIRPFGASFLGGVSLAAADLGTFSNGSVVNAAKQDGRAELIVGSGPTVAPVVRVYDTSADPPVVVDTIRPFSASFVGGVSVAAARMNADGIPDLIISSGRRGGSATEIYDGRVGAGANPRLKQYEAFAALGRSSAASYAQAIDRDGDGRLDTIYSVQGAGGSGGLTKVTLTDTGVTRSAVAGVSGALNVAATGVRANPAFITTASGLKYREIVAGTRDAGAVGKLNTVNYTGVLLDEGTFNNGQKVAAGAQFDSSRDPGGEPFVFRGNGRVTRVLLTGQGNNRGSGYADAPTVTFAAPPTGGVRAEGRAVLGTGADAGKVVSVMITKEGSGYTSAPSVTFSPPASGGTQATGSVQIDRVIQGWNEALPLMKVDGRYQFIIPANLAYGASETLPSTGKSGIPPNSTLVFDIELISST